jgi:geranylgeranyl diphosphate synthase, type II
MTFEDYLAAERDRIDHYLETVLPLPSQPPHSLHEAVRYTVFAGGKRFRPILANAVCAALGGDPERSLPGAAAIEMIHVSSLIHDDLPCMDDSDTRRGRPSCHKAFDEATAVLAGDWLLVFPFELLGREAGAGRIDAAVAGRLTGVIAGAVCSSGIIAGQIDDLAAESRQIGLEELERIHALKTASLIEACALVGAISAGVSDDLCEAVRASASALGRCFQVVDDILDVVGTEEELGKPTGADSRQEKSTYVSFFGLDEARRRADSLAREAHDTLAPLAATEALGRLHELIDFVLERSS